MFTKKDRKELNSIKNEIEHVKNMVCGHKEWKYIHDPFLGNHYRECIVCGKMESLRPIDWYKQRFEKEKAEYESAMSCLEKGGE